jgi:hypothetical protein
VSHSIYYFAAVFVGWESVFVGGAVAAGLAAVGVIVGEAAAVPVCEPGVPEFPGFPLQDLDTKQAGQAVDGFGGDAVALHASQALVGVGPTNGVPGFPIMASSISQFLKCNSINVYI